MAATAVVLLQIVALLLSSCRARDRAEVAAHTAEHLDLLRAAGPQSREGWLSGADPGAGLPALVRRLAPGAGSQAALIDAKRRVLDAVRRDPSAASTHALGVAQLLDARRPESIDRAIRLLHQAAELGADRGAVLNDLAVGYLARAGADAPAAQLRAYEAVRAALAAAPGRSEAILNEALIVERLGFTRRALGLWEAAMPAVENPAWRRQAEAHARSLRRQLAADDWKPKRQLLLSSAHLSEPELRRIVEHFAQPVRLLVEHDLLGTWARSGDGETSRNRLLARAGRLARQLAEVGGDTLLMEHLERVSGADTRGDRELLELHVRARVAFLEGRAALYDRWLMDEARARFRESRRLYQRLEDPYWTWCAFHEGLAVYYAGDYELSIELLSALIGDLDGTSFGIVRGRALWVRALALSVVGRVERALADYEEAIRQFSGAGEMDSLATTLTLHAHNLHKLGDRERAWDEIAESLRLGSRMHEDIRRFTALNGPLILASSDERLALASLFADELVAVADESANDRLIYDGYLRRAGLQHQRARLPEALADLARSLAASERLADPEMRARADADSGLVRAELLLEESPRQAAELLESAIEYYRRTDHKFLLGRAYRARAAAEFALGDLSATLRSLGSQLELFEQTQIEVDDRERRIFHWLEARLAFGWLVDLHAGEFRRPREALRFAEAARAFVTHASTPLAVDEVQQHLAEDEAILVFYRSPERLHRWMIDRDEVEYARLAADPRHIDRSARRLAAALQTGAPEAAWEEAGKLYGALLADLGSRPSAHAVLCIVPDGDLRTVPFEFLRDAENGLLGERHAVAYGQSASECATGLRRVRRERSERVNSVLAVGNPSLDPGLGLPALENAERSAHAVAALYPRADLLTNGAATKQAFLERAPRAEVLYFAGHAIADYQRPLSSRLYFASRPGDPGILRAREVTRDSLARCRLAVLAACETVAFESERPASAAASLVHVFLEAGVPAIVATLWRVTDAESADLLVLFHAAYVATGDPLTSLRAARRLEAPATPADYIRHAPAAPYVLYIGP